MVKSFFPLKKLRRSGKHLLFLILLMLGAFAVYHEFVATNAWRSTNSRFSLASEDSLGRRPTQERLVRVGGERGEGERERDSMERRFGGDAKEDSEAWRSSYTPQPWRPEQSIVMATKPSAMLCSKAREFTRLVWQLYSSAPQKPALPALPTREFVFAVSSDDNSEFWLSRDNSPLNLQLLAWIGKTGMAWTAPGEFGKYASQTSRPVRLSVQRRYFFEIIHKQNDRGTDHIEVAWQLNQEGLRFTVISSKYISLYSNESALRMSDITHVPQTAASHTRSSSKQPDNQLSNQPAADMLRVDPRDTLYQIPALDSRFLQGVLPDCSYKPSYIIKGFPLLRYQGLQFVHMSYIYPNDYTRLTHMETDNTCFYHDSPLYLDRYGFSRYMRLDEPEGQEGESRARVVGILRRRKAVPEEGLDGEAPPNVGGARKKDHAPPDYGDDYDDYAQRRRRKLFSLPQADRAPTHRHMSDTLTYKKRRRRKRRETNAAAVVEQQAVVQTRATEQDGLEIPPGPGSHTSLQTTPAEQLRLAERPAEQLRPVKSRAGEQKPGGKPADREDMGPADRKQPRPRERPAEQNSAGLKILPAPPKLDQNLTIDRDGPVEGDGLADGYRPEVWLPQLQGRHQHVQQPGPRGRANAAPNPLQDRPSPTVTNWSIRVGRGWRLVNRTLELWSAVTKQLTTRLPEVKPPLIKLDHEETVTRKRVQVLETDIILRAQPQIKSRPKSDYDNTLYGDLPPGVVRGMNRLVEGVDRGGGGERVGEREGEEVGVSESLWGLEGDSEEGDGLSYDSTPPPVFDPEVNWAQTFQVTPVDLQAMRSDWIDLRCNLELRDVNGQYLRLSHYIYALIRHRLSRPRGLPPLHPAPEMFLCNPVGFHWNPTATVHFIVPVKNQARWVQQLIVDMEGLQAGIDLITNEHSIVFLCDLHIHFPPSIIDSVRKHSGGMNTHDFTDRWGGEDWELLDRVLQSGLEVERIYMRNFLHHYHSKRGMWNRRTQRSGT
ncbi:unnamed protein product [Coregonus sp. 'balchen']|nr:unnamed protein product [Coregonus sp. 'balchen']